MKTLRILVLAAFGLLVGLCASASSRAETADDWIRIGQRIHGDFGALIPVGIRIGLDALRRLGAEPREVTVVYYNADKAPPPCIADGIMIATASSPGQGTLEISAEKAPTHLLGVAIIRHKQSGVQLKYTVARSWLDTLIKWNEVHDEKGRYNAVMQANNLFEVNTSQLEGP